MQGACEKGEEVDPNHRDSSLEPLAQAKPLHVTDGCCRFRTSTRLDNVTIVAHRTSPIGSSTSTSHGELVGEGEISAVGREDLKT